MKEYTEQGYVQAVSLDLSKYFDTLNHQRLLNLLRENVDDERVIQLIKRYHRIRMCIWKMWKRPRSKMRYLMRLGIPANARQLLKPPYTRTVRTVV